MADDHVFRRPSGTRSGPFTTRRVAGGVSAPGGEGDLSIADIPGLQDALDNKAALEHDHEVADVTELQNALNAKANTTHTHSISQVNGLGDELNAKASASHAGQHVTGGSDKIRDATPTHDGLMTAAFAAKLNSVETNANNYVLPIPTLTTMGGVKRNTGAAGQFVKGIDGNGNLEYDTPEAGGPGGSTLSDPGVAYVRQHGSDTTGEVGKPDKPFLTGTAAFAAGARSFDFGLGNFSIETQGVFADLFIRGRGTSGKTGVNVLHYGTPGTPGEAGTDGAPSEIEGSPAGDGGHGGPGGNGGDTSNLIIHSDHSAYIAVVAVAGAGGDGGAGGNGGVDLASGGVAGNPGSGGNGGNGGTTGSVYLHHVSGVVDIRPGPAGAAGAPGSGASSGSGGLPGNEGMASQNYFTFCRMFQDFSSVSFASTKMATLTDNAFYAFD